MPIRVADRQPSAELWAAAGAMSGFAMSEESRLRRQQMAVQIMQQLEQIKMLKAQRAQVGLHPRMQPQQIQHSPPPYAGRPKMAGNYQSRRVAEQRMEGAQPVQTYQQARYANSKAVARQRNALRRVSSAPSERQAMPFAGATS